jgi:hypothetical protein
MYIYIVSRTVLNPEIGVPRSVLGVHTSKTKALNHFNSIVQDRIDIRRHPDQIFTCHWDRDVYDCGTDKDSLTSIHKDVREAYLKLREEIEYLYIEKWKV